MFKLISLSVRPSSAQVLREQMLEYIFGEINRRPDLLAVEKTLENQLKEGEISKEYYAHYLKTKDALIDLLFLLKSYQKPKDFEKAMPYIFAALLHRKENIEDTRTIQGLPERWRADVTQLIVRYHNNMKYIQARYSEINKFSITAEKKRELASSALRIYLTREIEKLEELFLYFADIVSILETFPAARLTGEDPLYIYTLGQMAEQLSTQKNDMWDVFSRSLFLDWYKWDNPAWYGMVMAHATEHFNIVEDYCSLEHSLIKLREEFMEIICGELGIPETQVKVVFRLKGLFSLYEKTSGDIQNLKDIRDIKGIRLIFDAKVSDPVEKEVIDQTNFIKFVEAIHKRHEGLLSSTVKGKAATRAYGGLDMIGDPVLLQLVQKGFIKLEEITPRDNNFKDYHLNIEGAEIQVRTGRWDKVGEETSAKHDGNYKAVTNFLKEMMSYASIKTPEAVFNKMKKTFGDKSVVLINNEIVVLKSAMSWRVSEDEIRAHFKKKIKCIVDTDGIPINDHILIGQSVIIEFEPL